MDRVDVSTVVYLPPEEVYDFLLDFPRYGKYSEHLREVRQYGDGSPGTEYELEFAWWKLSYTTRSKVTDVSPPSWIDWRVVKDVDAVGCWVIEAVDDLEEPRPLAGEPPAPDRPADGTPATRVTLQIQYRPESADRSRISLPRFVSFDWVVEKVTPKIRSEAETVVRRIVADLEGDSRDVVLEIETS